MDTFFFSAFFQIVFSKRSCSFHLQNHPSVPCTLCCWDFYCAHYNSTLLVRETLLKGCWEDVEATSGEEGHCSFLTPPILKPAQQQPFLPGAPVGSGQPSHYSAAHPDSTGDLFQTSWFKNPSFFPCPLSCRTEVPPGT